jgi:hypothetical protein
MQTHVELSLAPDTLIQRKDERHLTNPVGDESVLLNLETGDYLGLNRVAASIWRLLENPIRLSELEEALMSVYDTDINTCRVETLAFLNRISALGLLMYPVPQDRSHASA